MCGRFTLRSPSHQVAQLFELDMDPALVPRYNIAPTQEIPVVRIDPETSARELTYLRWGLVPSWADDPSIGNRMINARAETAPAKPAFRAPFRKRRCLVPCDGFYEWMKHGKSKQPYYVTMRDGKPFALAGLWEPWERDGEIIESCTILTTSANALVRPFHDRMPVIVNPHDFNTWLDPNIQDAHDLEPLLKPYPAESMSAFPVSTMVNNARHEAAGCVKPMVS